MFLVLLLSKFWLDTWSNLKSVQVSRNIWASLYQHFEGQLATYVRRCSLIHCQLKQIVDFLVSRYSYMPVWIFYHIILLFHSFFFINFLHPSKFVWNFQTPQETSPVFQILYILPSQCSTLIFTEFEILSDSLKFWEFFSDLFKFLRKK